MQINLSNMDFVSLLAALGHANRALHKQAKASKSNGAALMMEAGDYHRLHHELAAQGVITAALGN